jgi:hypothetical protein
MLAVRIGYSPAPGESRTTIIVWEIDDPSKSDDPRYWWQADEIEHLRKLSSDMPDIAGRPRGESLGSLRRRAERDEVELGGVHGSVRIPLGHWRDADPERTYLIIMHVRRPTADEQEAMKAEWLSWDFEVEMLRQEWLAAEGAGEHGEAAEARRRFEAALTQRGFRKACDSSPWDPERAHELLPGVFVQDERPSTRR